LLSSRNITLSVAYAELWRYENLDTTRGKSVLKVGESVRIWFLEIRFRRYLLNTSSDMEVLEFIKTYKKKVLNAAKTEWQD